MQINVTQTVQIKPIEGAFSEDFMREFREGFYPFYDMEDHLKHIAQLIARGIVPEINTPDSTYFVEGYAEIGRFIETAKIIDCEEDEVLI